MNLYHHIAALIHQALRSIPEFSALDFSKIDVSPTKDPTHGELSTNAAMVVAPQVKGNPKAVAEQLVAALKSAPEFSKIEIAGPGFINMTLVPSVWQKHVVEILQTGVKYGQSTMGAGKKVNVEFVSANPTGPMHVGHARYVVGDALASLLQKAGYDVTREYYINDSGSQVDKLAESAYLRYREAMGEKIGAIPEGLYPGEYLMDVGRAMAAMMGDSLMQQSREEWLPVVRDFTLEAVMAMIKEDLALLGVKHDVFSSERAITAAGKVDKAIASLKGKGLIYEGVLEAPKGKVIEDWEPKPQTLFKSSQFGDDSDRAVKKIGWVVDVFRAGYCVSSG